MKQNQGIILCDACHPARDIGRQPIQVEDFRCEIVTCCIVEEITVVLPDDAERCLAKTRGTFHNRIENRLSIGWRPANNIKNFARCRLIFERLLQFGRAFLYLFESIASRRRRPRGRKSYGFTTSEPTRDLP
jgi:hypothetical protein